MADYLAVNLDAHCNVGVSFYEGVQNPLLGEQVLHGLPFRIGSAPDRCFIGFGTPDLRRACSIPIGNTAYHVIFAHVLLEYPSQAGQVIAHYVFRYEDGEEVRAPIRERFEIASLPRMWGIQPFLAYPDMKDRLMPRTEGRWDNMGLRQTEALAGYPRSYYLWAWQNPHPEKPIQSIRIEPGEYRFLIAGITLGQVDEYPFVRTGRVPVRITLKREEDAQKPFSLQVDVDRGVATYVYALPQQSAEQFLSAPFSGWGEEQNTTSSPSYVQIAAIPSATVTVKSGEEPLGSAKWGELLRQKQVDTPRVRLEVLDRGKNWVHVTVVDDATGKPVPCRIHFRSPEGVPYQPHGHHDHVNSNLNTWHVDVGGDLRLGQITYAYIDGTCQGWLPRGEVLVDVARGYEYSPLRTRVHIAPGQRELTLRLKRWKDMNAQRWFSGDSHVHFLGVQGAHLEAQCEDLNVVNLLQSQWGHLFTNTEDFTGEPTVSNRGRTIVYCSQENRQHVLGHLILWGLKRAVMPWCSGGPDEAELGGTLEETLAHWADRCREQGGTVIIPHFPLPNGEPAVLVATGRADAVEMIAFGDFQHHEYYRYLNCGYRLPLVGGTDKMSSEVAVGQYRTYAYLPPDEEFTYENWCKAVRAGRTFISGGALISFSVEGAQIGDTLYLPPGGGTVEVEAIAESIFPIHTLQIVQQGQVAASAEEPNGANRLHLKTKLQVKGNTWMAARCAGPNYTAIPHFDVWRRGVFAHTSPIYIACGQTWSLFDHETAQYMLTLIEGGIAYIRQRSAQHSHDTVTHHHGEEDHLAYLERPFHEAIEAIRRRMQA
ncbi:MAG: CehA/McbA family metallohydrolase [Chthonomonadetes bacterium]|nr:CehA/McbA family metallohydrolase [Chthonomonadetes bacterium]